MLPPFPKRPNYTAAGALDRRERLPSKRGRNWRHEMGQGQEQAETIVWLPGVQQARAREGLDRASE
jgi:hypothetical protein